MFIRERVNSVLGDWCGLSPANQTISLEDLWDLTRNNQRRPHDMPFQPDGVEDLLGKLSSEFKKLGQPCIEISELKKNNFKPNGDIDSVDDLVEAVAECRTIDCPQEGALQ